MNSTLNVFTLVQFFFAVIIGMYFWNQLKKQNGNKKAIQQKSRKEMDKLRRMRRISLTEPLAEKTRPNSFDDIIGQEKGIDTLKAAICGKNPQHIIIYGPPGIGKTAAARLVMEEAKKTPESPFNESSKFIELDATIARFDERSIADPLIGSVHDPIYQGAGPMGVAGIPEPKPGAVTKAHGGMLFIDEIGELHPMQINKLLKVLEDRKVFLDSAYYSEENNNIPGYIHEIFQNGLPADFRLVGATTKQPHQIPPAIRSRCLEIFFRELTIKDVKVIAKKAVTKIGFQIEESGLKLLGKYARNGREAVNMIQLAVGMAIKKGKSRIDEVELENVINSGHYTPRPDRQAHTFPQIGVVNGLAVTGASSGILLEIEVAAIHVKKEGKISVTGVIEEEEMGSPGHTMRRKSMVKESAENALTVLRRMMPVEPGNYDIHINLPGGMPVDGPSAGVSMAVAIYSALTGNPVDNKVAMTGEVSIRGLIKPVGGVLDKIEAARLAGVNKVLIPNDNWKNLFRDYEDIEVIPIKCLEEAIEKSVKQEKKEKIKLITSENLMKISQ